MPPAPPAAPDHCDGPALQALEPAPAPLARRRPRRLASRRRPLGRTRPPLEPAPRRACLDRCARPPAAGAVPQWPLKVRLTPSPHFQPVITVFTRHAACSPSRRLEPHRPLLLVLPAPPLLGRPARRRLGLRLAAHSVPSRRLAPLAPLPPPALSAPLAPQPLVPRRRRPLGPHPQQVGLPCCCMLCCMMCCCVT
jgi:hypothetical protein